jgi:SAM-dependent methyltransferase
MSIKVLAQAKMRGEDRLQLEERLRAYYSNPPSSYYAQADRAAGQYTPELQPFHCALVSRVKPGFAVLEVGCGSAHLCAYVEAGGASYTGLDYSAQLLEQNRRRFPKARFFSLGDNLSETFDVVASLYTIEHVIDPPFYLETLWNFCRPGGFVAIICPDFVDGSGFPPSFYYGQTPRRLRSKIASLAFHDAVKHLIDLFWFAPRWKRRARSSAPGAFWMNLAPRVFAGADYDIDADAVHLPRFRDLVWWFQSRTATIVETSQSLAIPDPTVVEHNCYILARKSG